MGSGTRPFTRGMTLDIRGARRDDLEVVVEIERVSFGDPWTRGMFSTHLAHRHGNDFLVADDDSSVVGYAISRTVVDESELLNIAVDPARRNQSIGARLLDAMMERCESRGAADMWLEVRASNAGARKLYTGRGFVAVGVRKSYYQAPREDAIVLRADLRAFVGNKKITEAALGFSAEALDPIPSPARHIHRQETK